MKSKKIIIVVIAIILLISASGFFLIRKLVSFAGDYQKSIYTDNSKIVSSADSYSFFNNQSKINGDTLTETFNKFTGMVTVYDLKATDNATIKLDFNADISSGDFKIVLIDPNDNITEILEQSSSIEQEIDIPSGKNRIKIVGYNAKGDIDLTISSADDVRIVAKNND